MSLNNEQNTNVTNGVNKTIEDDENHSVDNNTVEMTVKGKSRGKKKNVKSDIKVETKRITRRSCRGIEKINDIKINQQQQSTLNIKKQKDTTTNGDAEKLISDDKTVISNGQKNNDEIIKESVDSNEINSSKTQGLRAYRPARRSMLSMSSSSIQNDSYSDADLQTNESPGLEDNQHTKESSTISDCQDHSDDLNNSTSAVEALTKPNDYQEDNNIINNDNSMTESNEPLINKNDMEDQLNINNISTNIKKESVKLTDDINDSQEINENELLKNNEDNSMDNLNDNKLKNSNNNTSKRRGRSRKSKTSQNQLITNFFVSQKTDDSVPGTSREEIYLKQETFVDTTDDLPNEEQNDQLDNEVVKKYPSRSKKRKINNSDENIPTSSRKRTRKNTDEVDGKGLSESDTEDVLKKEKDNNDKPYKPRERTRKTPKTTKKSSKNSVKKLTKCGKCEKEFENWEEHNLLDHHLIGWRDGEEQPNLSDVTVLREIKRALDREKNRKRRKYTCDKCPDVVLTSPEGFVSHIRFCGKSEDELLALKWECPLCKRLYNPSSQYAHERSHKLREENAKKNELQSQIDDENDGRCKRTAAKKAATKITEFVDLVKDNKDDNKKTKLNKITMMKEMIPDIMPSIKIPPVLIKTWKSSLEKKNIACCHQFKCKFTADNFDEICRHYSECKLAPVVYFKCKICKDFSGHKFEVEKHIKDDHIKKQNNEDSDFVASDNSRVSDDDDDDYDYDNDKVTSKSNQHSKICKPVRTVGRANFLTSIGPVQSKNLHATYTPALQWTMDFEFDNYQSSLFQDLKQNKFNIVNDDNLCEQYLPQLKLSMSMKNENNKSSSEWKKWKRFESDIVDKVPSFFTGGPVWAIAWLPIPSILYEDEPNQYLAVCTHPKMEDTYQVSKSYKFKNSIQIWNIGHISMNSSSVLSKPECSYILAHENGTVWSMEWCPSGTYEINKTMGLLATGSSDGCVHIYSLPFPETLEKTTNNPPVFMSPPVMTLHINQDLENSTNRNWQCLKISWSKTNGHNIIAAGFSNGYVALWDLSMKSSLLLSNIKGKTIHLDAFIHFYAHAHAVMHVQIIPIDGERYIATVGMDRETKTWDIEDISSPMDSMKKGVAVNGAYITHWPALFTSYDDALGLGHTQTYMAVVREASLHGEQRVTPLLPTNSPCYGIATSDWANGVCHSTLAGDITALFPGQLLYVKDFDKLSRKRWLVTSIETVDFNKLNGDAKIDDNVDVNVDDNIDDNVDATNKKNNNKKQDKNNKSKKEYEYGPEYYEQCHDKFGIIFKDDLNRTNNKLSPSNRKSAINSDAMNAAPIEQYPFTSINRLAWNSNAWSYLWLAAGYQNGLVRLLSLNTMSMSNTIKKILPAHVKKMSSKKKLNSSESIIDIKNPNLS